MESQHTAKNINVSIRKVRTLLPAIKRMSPSDALVRLQHLPNSAARALAQALQTVMANAETSLKVNKDMLEFRKINADQGIVLKRFRAGSRGTAQPITHRMTHITMVLGVKKINTSPVVSAVEQKKPKQTETKTKPVTTDAIKKKVSRQKGKVAKTKKITNKEH